SASVINVFLPVWVLINSCFDPSMRINLFPAHRSMYVYESIPASLQASLMASLIFCSDTSGIWKLYLLRSSKAGRMNPVNVIDTRLEFKRLPLYRLKDQV